MLLPLRSQYCTPHLLYEAHRTGLLFVNCYTFPCGQVACLATLLFVAIDLRGFFSTKIPEDAAFFSDYYHNHRVLQHGNLMSMVQFQTSVPWIALKSYKSTYFTWLKECKVYLNHTKFKTDTLVACGFLVGAHPGHLRRDEAEVELRVSLDADPDKFPFQLSSRSISVPVKEGDPSRYSFQAIVVETSTQLASTIWEKFYELDQPAKAQAIYPYTGMYQFVPLLKSKEWPVDKIYKLARLHVNLIESLRHQSSGY